jgi:hypothetical protein
MERRSLSQLHSVKPTRVTEMTPHEDAYHEGMEAEREVILTDYSKA